MAREQNDQLAAVFQHEANVSQDQRIEENVRQWIEGSLPGYVSSPSQQRVLNREETLQMTEMARAQAIMQIRNILQSEGVSMVSTHGISRIVFPTQDLANEFSQLIFNLDTARIGDGAICHDTAGQPITDWIPRCPQIENNQICVNLFTKNHRRNAGDQNEVLVLQNAGISLRHLQPNGRVRFSLSQTTQADPSSCSCLIL